jgi:hypothetical protein
MGHRGVKGDTMESKRVVKARKIGWVNCILLTVFLIGIPSFVHADISDILLKFYPYITAQEEYSTNILLSPNPDKLDDWITTVTPGLRFSHLQAGRNGIDLDVNGGYNYYAKNNDLSYWSASGRLDAWYAVTPRLTFRLRDYLVRSDAARESRYQSQYLYDAEGNYIGDTQPDQFLLATQRGVQAIYFRNVVEPRVEYRFGRENLASLLYRNNIYRNKNKDLYDDSTEHSVNPLLNYWFDVRNGVSLEYIFTYGVFVGSEGAQDLVGHEVRTRYTHRVDPKLSFFGEYIFIADNFESPGVDYDVHNPSLGMEYKFSPTLTGTLQGGYFWQLAEDDSTNRGPFFRVSLIQRGQKTSYALTGEGGYYRDYFTSENLGFQKYYRAYGTINHRLTNRLTVQLTGSGERPWYQEGRKDWIWDGRVSASYMLHRWVTVALEGGYRECRSTVESFDYTEYSGIFRITVARPGYQPAIPMGRSTL